MSERIVGHKTHMDGSHSPITEGEADAIMAACDAADAVRREQMPDSMAAINVLHDARQRLRDEGWSGAQYCPKDGSLFAVIEYGSTGIFEATYWGKWPDGRVYCCDGFTHPHGMLWKPIEKLTDAERDKLAECMDIDRQLGEREVQAFMAETQSDKLEQSDG